MKSVQVSMLLVLMAVTGYAQIRQFDYKRKIDTSATDWHRIILPDDIFQYIQPSFSDLRIYSINTSDTVEIPYLLNIKLNKITEEIVELPVVNLSRKNNKLFFTVQLPPEKQLNELNLEIDAKNFDGWVSLEGSHQQKEWYEIVTGKRILSIHEGAISFSITSVSFPVSDYRYMRAVIGSDTKLNITKAYFKRIQIDTGSIKPHTVVTLTTENKNKQSSTVFKLNSRIPVSKVDVLASHDIDYYRPYVLEYLVDSVQTQKGWLFNYAPLKKGYLTSFKANTIEFEPVVAPQFRLTIFNSDNPPVMINQVDVFGPEVELVANLKAGDTFLFYGNPDLQKPLYDLVLFKDKIPEAAALASLNQQESSRLAAMPRSPLFQSNFWLWSIMALIIGILGYFTVRMMTPKQN